MPPTDTTELRPRPARDEIVPAAMEIVRRHGGEVMAVARRWAETPEDAEDAYQRGLEIMLTKAPSTDPDHLLPWLKTVVKREAWAVRRQRERHTPGVPNADDLDTPGVTTSHDLAERRERLQVGAEAMHRLKPQEVRALALKAEGLSYREICDETGWSYTKVNRCLSEGRRRFAERLAGIESGAECDRLAPQLSALADGEARPEDVALLRQHLRTCLVCRARLRDYRAAPARVAAMAPPVAVGYSLLDSARFLADAAFGWLSARPASLAVRWHQAAELAAAHKGAAVAASAAVLAGGGAATVATVGGGERPAVVRPAARDSILATPPSAPSNENPDPLGTTASNGGTTSRATPSGEKTSEDRDRARTTPPTSQSAPPVPPAGEFTPDPAHSEPAATNAERPAGAAGSETDAGGEFAP